MKKIYALLVFCVLIIGCDNQTKTEIPSLVIMDDPLTEAYVIQTPILESPGSGLVVLKIRAVIFDKNGDCIEGSALVGRDIDIRFGDRIFTRARGIYDSEKKKYIPIRIAEKDARFTRIGGFVPPKCTPLPFTPVHASPPQKIPTEPQTAPTTPE